MRLVSLCAIAVLAAPAAAALATDAATGQASCDPIWWTGTDPHVDVSCIGSGPAGPTASPSRCDPIWWTGMTPHVDLSCLAEP